MTVMNALPSTRSESIVARVTDRVVRCIDALGPRPLTLITVASVLPALIWRFASDLSEGGRIVLCVFLAAVAGWTLTRMNDCLVAVLAGIALVLTNVTRPDKLFAALGHELIWLLIAAFALAAVVKESGVAERVVRRALGRVRTTAALFHGVTAAIVATAFVIPSTSGRAAILLPVFLALASVISDRRRIRALALVFPTAILLSAFGSMIGAGAHLVALDFVGRLGGTRLDYLGWLVLAAPFALVVTHLATGLILALFLNSEERRAAVAVPSDEGGTRRSDRPIYAVLAATVGFWVTEPWHGVPMAIVAVCGALVATLPGVSRVSLKSALKSAEWDLLIFMAVTIMLGHALLESDVDEWLMRHVLAVLGLLHGASSAFVILGVAIIAILAHLLVTSRTARALILVPSIALPLAGLGFDPLAVALVVVAGTGFCQTMTASAKPVAMFAALDRPTYEPADLLRLAIWLYPLGLAVLMIVALFVWPMLGLAPMR